MSYFLRSASIFINLKYEDLMQIIHNETDGISTRATAKAMVKLLSRDHIERGGFFIMKRTAGQIIETSFFQRDIGINEVY